MAKYQAKLALAQVPEIFSLLCVLDRYRLLIE